MNETGFEYKNQAPLPAEAKRTVKIGAKVTPEQRNHIYGLAKRCNMTVSSYLLARAYNYRPKERLTQHQLSLLENLSNCRSDLVNFVSALHGMKRENRLQLFNSFPFMSRWLKLIGLMAKRIGDFLNRVQEPNRVPQGTSETSKANPDNLSSNSAQ